MIYDGKKVFISLLEWLVALLAVLDCNTVYSKIIGGRISSFSPFIAVALMLLLLANLNGARVHSAALIKGAAFFIVYVVSAILVYFFNAKFSQAPSGYIIKYLIITPLLLIMFLLVDNSDTILFKFAEVVTMVAIISLFFWIFASQLHWIHPSRYYYVRWGRPYHYPVYMNIYVERQTENFFGHRIVRNLAFFTEAPMYNTCLIIAIGIKAFVVKEQKLWKMIVLYTALISTFSTTGLMLGIIILLILYFQKRISDKAVLAFRFVFGILLVTSGTVLLALIFFQKTRANISWSGRIPSIIEGYKVMKDHLWFGSEYRSYSAFYKYMTPARRRGYRVGAGGSSSGIGAIMGQCGLLILMYYLNSFFASVIYGIRKHKVQIVYFSLLIFALFVFTIIQYTFTMLLVVAYLSNYMFKLNDYGEKHEVAVAA